MGMHTEITRSECDDKASYKSEEEAQAAAVVAAWQHGTDGTSKLKPYKCNHCGLYHLATDYDD